MRPSPYRFDAVKAPIGLVILLTSLVMVGQMSTSMYLPSLPSLANDLHVEAAGVKMTMTVFLAAFALAQLFFGPLSDRFGRRPALFLGLALYLLGWILFRLASRWKINPPRNATPIRKRVSPPKKDSQSKPRPAM